MIRGIFAEDAMALHILLTLSLVNPLLLPMALLCHFYHISGTTIIVIMGCAFIIKSIARWAKDKVISKNAPKTNQTLIPSVNLRKNEAVTDAASVAIVKSLARAINQFKVKCRIISWSHGSVFTVVKLRLENQRSVSRLSLLLDDISRMINASSVRLQEVSKHVILEIKHSDFTPASLGSIITSPLFFKNSGLIFGLGLDIIDDPLLLHLRTMGNLMILGDRKDDRNMLLESIIVPLLYKNDPELAMLVIDYGSSLYRYHGVHNMVVTKDESGEIMKWSAAELRRRGRMQSRQKVLLIINDLEYLASHGRLDRLTSLLGLLHYSGPSVNFHIIAAVAKINTELVRTTIIPYFPNKCIFRVGIDEWSVLLQKQNGVEQLSQDFDMLYIHRDCTLSRVRTCSIEHDESESIMKLLEK